MYRGVFSLVCFLIYGVKSKSGHVWFQTFGPIWHVSGPKIVFWRNDIMILHHFCRRSSKIKLFWQKTLIFNPQFPKYSKKSWISFYIILTRVVPKMLSLSWISGPSVAALGSACTLVTCGDMGTPSATSPSTQPTPGCTSWSALSGVMSQEVHPPFRMLLWTEFISQICIYLFWEISFCIFN